MIKEFVSYEQALELKELGFDEGCLDQYKTNCELWGLRLGFIIKNQNLSEGSCSAALYQQAFRWFRDKHDLHNGIYPYYDEYEFQIKDFRLPTNIPINGEIMSYEEAELACLIELIKIVKNKQHEQESRNS